MHSLTDVRNLSSLLFWAAMLVVAAAALRRAGKRPPGTGGQAGGDGGLLMSLVFLVAPFVPSSNLLFPVGFRAKCLGFSAEVCRANS